MNRILSALIVIFLRWTHGSMSDIDCGKGMVRDLDGTCVEKIVIVKHKGDCPKITIDNGEIFVMGKSGSNDNKEREPSFICRSD